MEERRIALTRIVLGEGGDREGPLAEKKARKSSLLVDRRPGRVELLKLAEELSDASE